MKTKIVRALLYCEAILSIATHVCIPSFILIKIRRQGVMLDWPTLP